MFSAIVSGRWNFACVTMLRLKFQARQEMTIEMKVQK